MLLAQFDDEPPTEPDVGRAVAQATALFKEEDIFSLQGLAARARSRTRRKMSGWDPLQWLRDHGGSVGAVATASWPETVHGSGLVATADIARGDLLLSVPAPLSLTALPGPREENLHEGHRLCLRLLGERCRGPASQWHAWLSSLPTTFETPLQWPDADLEVHVPRTCHAHTMHTPCTHHAHTLLMPCTHHAHSMHTACPCHAHTAHIEPLLEHHACEGAAAWLASGAPAGA